jgi:hypothetical protein
MRSIFAVMIIMAASTAVVQAGEARKHAEKQPAYRYTQAPVDHRQPTEGDVTGANQIQFDNKSIAELLDLPASPSNVIGADELHSKDNALARMIGQENSRLDREISGICRGC